MKTKKKRHLELGNRSNLTENQSSSFFLLEQHQFFFNILSVYGPNETYIPFKLYLSHIYFKEISHPENFEAKGDNFG